MEQFSQISTIKRHHQLNSRNNSKEFSELKYSQASAILEQNESLNIEKLLTSIGKREEPSFEQSVSSYMPVTNISQFQQRKLNGTGNKNVKHSFCTAILNTTNPSLAIQSEPNSMLMGFSSYFETEELDYESRFCVVPKQHDLGARKILKFVLNAQNRNYKLRIGFHHLKEYSKASTQLYLQSLSVRQSRFINLALKKRQDQYWHEKTHDKIGMPYYNKLMGLLAGDLVANKKIQLIDKNVEKFKVLKEETNKKILQQSQTNRTKYKFNFQIIPELPLHFQKKASEKSSENISITPKKRK